MKKNLALILAPAVLSSVCLCNYIRPVYGREVDVKKAVMIIARQEFKDEELFKPKEVLEAAGIEVKVASTTPGSAQGVDGRTVKPDIQLKDLDVREFDAVIFVGGAGATQYWNDPLAHRIARDAYGQNKVVGAICIAPVTLARSGILRGKRATVWSSESGQLKTAGAQYTGADVEKDGKIITGAGPFAAGEFGEELVKEILH